MICRNVFTTHTPRDLAGWHICLDVFQALLDGTPMESRGGEWDEWYNSYKNAIARLVNSPKNFAKRGPIIEVTQRHQLQFALR